MKATMTTRTRQSLLLAAAALAIVLPDAARAQEADAKLPDLVAKAVDPYDIGHQRARFLKAAGIDTELDAKEFEADAEREDGFVTSYDAWKAMTRFDRNRNGSLDWFEADAYRRDIRGRMLKAFDANKNNRLDGAERPAANEALNKGKLPAAAPKTSDPRLAPSIDKPAPPSRPAAGGPPAGFPQASAESEQEIREFWDTKRKELEKAHDKNGNGRIDGDERRAYFTAYREAMQERVLAKFDVNGNGELDQNEREAFGAYQRQRGELRRKQFIADNDTDGDGELNDKEREAAREKMREQWRTRRYDTDGDGKLSDAERQAMEDQRKKEDEERNARRKAELDKYDKDGDGDLSRDERRARDDDRRNEWLKRRYDRNNDGQLDGEEQAALDKEKKRIEDARERFRKEMLERYDKNKDGELDDEEREAARRGGGGRDRGRFGFSRPGGGDAGPGRGAPGRGGDRGDGNRSDRPRPE